MPKSALVLMFTLGLGLACTGGARNDQDTASGDDDSVDGWFTPDVSCSGGQIEFTAEASASIVGIRVEVFDGEASIEVVDLTFRGAGDWYTVTTNEDSYEACMNGSASYFLFVGTTESGDEIEQGI